MSVRSVLRSLVHIIDTNPGCIRRDIWDLDDLETFDDIAALIANVQQHYAQGDGAELFARTEALLADLAAVAPSPSDPRDVPLDFLRFMAALQALSFAIEHELYVHASEWVAAGLTEQRTTGNANVTFRADVRRIKSFVASDHPAIAAHGRITVLGWTTLAFTFFAKSASMREIAGPAASLCLPIAMRSYAAAGPLQRYALLAICSIYHWASTYEDPRGETLFEYLNKIYADGTHPFSLDILPFLAMRAVGRKDPDVPMIRRYLARHSEDMGSSTRLNLIAALAEDLDRYDSVRHDLYSVLQDVHRSRSHRPRVLQHRVAEEVSGVVQPIVASLSSERRVSEALKLVRAAFGDSADGGLSDALVVAPFALPRGTLWASSTHTAVAGSAGGKDRARVIETLNAAIGSTYTYNPTTGFEDRHPEHFGDGSRLISATLGTAVAELLGLSELKSLPTLPIFPLFNLPLPLQATMLNVNGFTRPITTSLRVPAADRPVRRVGIWYHPIDPSHDEFGEAESHSVAAAFEKAGADVVTWRSGSSDDLARFRTMYCRADLDVLWVIGHGSQQAFRPERSYLDVLQGREGVPFDELVELAVPGDLRRLLVLNVCSAAHPSTSAGLTRTTIAHATARWNQAVVAHLWPVTDMPAAALAAILANRIAGGSSFFEGYSAATEIMTRGNRAIIAALNGCGEFHLAERAGDVPFGIENPYYSYSAVFYA